LGHVKTVIFKRKVKIKTWGEGGAGIDDKNK